jgi:hypothetical protein
VTCSAQNLKTVPASRRDRGSVGSGQDHDHELAGAVLRSRGWPHSGRRTRSSRLPAGRSLRTARPAGPGSVSVRDYRSRKYPLRLSWNIGCRSRRAARAAEIHDEIAQLPNGYETILGVGGRLLSAGQVQRVNVARALLKRAPLVILDEATSNLDSISERRIQTALTRLMAGRTTFTIAHRLSTLRDADLILVIDQGRLVATGRTHCYSSSVRSIAGCGRPSRDPALWRRVRSKTSSPMRQPGHAPPS